MEHLWWVLLFSNQSKIFGEITTSKFEGQMLHNSFSVDMRVHALQLKQWEILEQLLLIIVLEGCF